MNTTLASFTLVITFSAKKLACGPCFRAGQRLLIILGLTFIFGDI